MYVWGKSCTWNAKYVIETNVLDMYSLCWNRSGVGSTGGEWIFLTAYLIGAVVPNTVGVPRFNTFTAMTAIYSVVHSYNRQAMPKMNIGAFPSKTMWNKNVGRLISLWINVLSYTLCMYIIKFGGLKSDCQTAKINSLPSFELYIIHYWVPLCLTCILAVLSTFAEVAYRL